LLRDLRFNAVWDGTTITDANWQEYVQLVDACYVGLDGSRMPERGAWLGKVNQGLTCTG